MNKKQRCVLVTTAIFVVGTLLLPPSYNAYEGAKFSAGFHWLLGSGYNTVDVPLLLAEWVGICLVGFIAYLLCADKQNPKGSN